MILEVQTQSKTKLVGFYKFDIDQDSTMHSGNQHSLGRTGCEVLCNTNKQYQIQFDKVYSGPMLAIFVLKMFDWELGQ